MRAAINLDLFSLLALMRVHCKLCNSVIALTSHSPNKMFILDSLAVLLSHDFARTIPGLSVWLYRMHVNSLLHNLSVWTQVGLFTVALCDSASVVDCVYKSICLCECNSVCMITHFVNLFLFV